MFTSGLRRNLRADLTLRHHGYEYRLSLRLVYTRRVASSCDGLRRSLFFF
jgi:hypothetical protein